MKQENLEAIKGIISDSADELSSDFERGRVPSKEALENFLKSVAEQVINKSIFTKDTYMLKTHYGISIHALMDPVYFKRSNSSSNVPTCSTLDYCLDLGKFTPYGSAKEGDTPFFATYNAFKRYYKI